MVEATTQPAEVLSAIKSVDKQAPLKHVKPMESNVTNAAKVQVELKKDTVLKKVPAPSESNSAINIMKLQSEIKSEKGKENLKQVEQPKESISSMAAKVQCEVVSEKAKAALKKVETKESAALQTAKVQNAVVSENAKASLKPVQTKESSTIQIAKLQNELTAGKAKSELRSVPAPDEESQLQKTLKLQADIRKGTKLTKIDE